MRNEIIDFFERNLRDLEGDGGARSPLKLPPFELLPRDFLDFAEKDLNESSSTHSLVNVTSNLKRAVDCQLDFFLACLNLDKLYREKKLGVQRKLGFLRLSGIFSSRSIEKLNTIRNRLEHHYEMPKLDDVEVYFDLVAAFISVVEAALPAFGESADLSMSFPDGGAVSVEYFYKGPKIRLSLSRKSCDVLLEYEADLDTKDPVPLIADFTFLVKTYLLFRKFEDGTIGQTHFISALKNEVEA